MRHSGLRISLWIATLAVFAVTLSTSVAAESILQKMKRAALEQACRGGDQKSCQDLAKMGQKQGQEGQQQPGQPQQTSQQHPGQKPPKHGQEQSVGSATSESGPFKPPAGAKIEETVLAPVQDRAKFTVSPHGVHVATVENEGSRAVVWYDGIEGPKFDEIIPQNAAGGDQIIFSADGNRYAYCARSGNQFVVMVDGKELVRSSEAQSSGRLDGASCMLGFTSNSKHVFFLSTAQMSNPDTAFQRFVFDGRAEMPNGSTTADFRPVVFSPDGNHYAYIWNDPRRQKPYALIVDGKPVPYQAGAPQWTSDSKHLYTQRNLSGGAGTELLYDGKPIARAFSFQIYTTPASDMVVMAVTGGANFHPFSFLVVNGKKVPGSETVERGMIHDVVFSPDGKHYAAHCEDLNVHHYLIVDGKRQQEYNAIDKITFTPDSSTLIYTAIVNGKSFIVVGDKEYGGSGGILPPVLAPVGNRFASLLNNNGSGTSLLLDGKTTALNVRGVSDLSFTPDGQHYAYVSMEGGKTGHLVIDGTVLAQTNLNAIDSMDPENPAAMHYIVSADSKHFAHFGWNDATGMQGIFLDGQFVPTSRDGVNRKLVFSPDSKHLFWIHVYGDRPHRLFVDGKPLVDFYAAGNMVSIPHWLDFTDDGKLTFLAQDDNSLKRITVTLPPETSLQTMLGGSGAGAMQASQ